MMKSMAIMYAIISMGLSIPMTAHVATKNTTLEPAAGDAGNDMDCTIVKILDLTTKTIQI